MMPAEQLAHLLRKVRPIVSQAARQFHDAPSDMPPTHYHTLSYEGDLAALARYCRLLQNIDRALGDA